MRTALLLSILVMTFGCKKASTPDPLDGAPMSATGGDADAPEVEELGSDGTGGGGGGKKKSGDGGASDNAGGSATTDGGTQTAGGSGSAAGGGGGDGGGGGGGGGGEAKPGDPNPTQPGTPTGNVDFIMTGASGGTSSDAVKAALDKSKQRFRGCYGKEPSNSGVLKMRATIASDGLVEKAEVMGGNLALGPLVQCSVATVKSLKIAGAAAPATKATFDIKFSK